MRKRSGLVLARKEGLAPAWQQVGFWYGRRTRADCHLVLNPPGSLGGVVVDESNQPADHAVVYVNMAISSNVRDGSGQRYHYLPGAAARQLFSAPTDAAGHFVIRNFPTNASAHFAVKAPGKVVRPAENDSPGGPMDGFRAGDDIRLVVEAAGSVEGKIICTEAGQPPVAQLSLWPDPMRGVDLLGQNSVESTVNGSFHFEDLAPGNYRLVTTFGANASSEWVAAPVGVTIEAGRVARSPEVAAVRGALLEVATLGASDGKPVSQVEVSIINQNAQPLSSSAVSDKKGVARLYLMPGDYQVSAPNVVMAGNRNTVNVAAAMTIARN
jgi:hypothetical protein